MKITKKQLVITLSSIVILLASLAVMICDFVVPLDFWTHPILTFLFCNSVGFFALCLIVGLANKSVFNFFISAICVTFAVIYAFAHYSFWWIGLFVLVVLWAIIALVSFMIMGSKTEAIALNENPDYKNYKERAKEEKIQEKEELPEIKSFK